MELQALKIRHYETWARLTDDDDVDHDDVGHETVACGWKVTVSYITMFDLRDSVELVVSVGQIVNVINQKAHRAETNEIVKNICSCHNFFPLSSVQIIIIPACCLLCVL